MRKIMKDSDLLALSQSDKIAFTDGDVQLTYKQLFSISTMDATGLFLRILCVEDYNNLTLQELLKEANEDIVKNLQELVEKNYVLKVNDRYVDRKSVV